MNMFVVIPVPWAMDISGLPINLALADNGDKQSAGTYDMNSGRVQWTQDCMKRIIKGPMNIKSIACLYDLVTNIIQKIIY